MHPGCPLSAPVSAGHALYYAHGGYSCLNTATYYHGTFGWLAWLAGSVAQIVGSMAELAVIAAVTVAVLLGLMIPAGPRSPFKRVSAWWRRHLVHY